jgi:hypothetical protein
MALIILTLVSTTVAIVASFVAWRAWQEEHRRSHARIARLAADIAAGPGAAGDMPLHADAHAIGDPGAAAASTMFGAAAAPVAHARWGVSLVAGVLAIAALAAIAVIFSGESRNASVSAASRVAPTAGRTAANQPASVPADRAPLELVALTHERDGAALSVHGVVRTPPAGASAPLTAVVFGFNRDGGFVASGRSAVAPPAAGRDSAFTVIIPDAADVVRYRVSFRTEDRVVPHVDRRTKG